MSHLLITNREGLGSVYRIAVVLVKNRCITDLRSIVGFLGSVEDPVEIACINSLWNHSVQLYDFSLLNLSCLVVGMEKVDI